MQIIEDRTGQVLMEHPDPPVDGSLIWQWFWELDAARNYGMNGPECITYPDIAAWAQLTHTEVEEWEVRALKSMDSARLDETAKVTK